jgi:hypothetical protein
MPNPTPCPPTPKAPTCAACAPILHHRMLGNGYCTRPAETECQFESICESCTFFSTNSNFAAALQRQRDHAAEREQLARVDLFNLLLDRINEERTA